MTLYQKITISHSNLVYTQPLGLFINNTFITSSDGKTLETFNPATEEKIASFYVGNELDIDNAVKAARNAYENYWCKTSPAERGKLLLKLNHLIQEEREILASIETLDSGKPYYSNSLNDLDQIINLTHYFSGGADKYNKGQVIPLNHDKYAYTMKVPYGVVGQIIPWNYPLAMASWKIQSCLAAGNTIVIKPSENTSLSLLYLATLFKKAGFPPGVLNIVPGNGIIAGEALSKHMDVDKIAFTGSTIIGQKVMSMSALSNLKDVTLECGGKSAAVIFNDANLNDAIKWVANGIFYNSGQNCTANSRIYVQQDIYSKFILDFKIYVSKMWKFGKKLCTFDEECTIGPVISKIQYDRIQRYINYGKEIENLEFYEFGEYPTKGYFIPPIIFIDVPPTSKLSQEEIFGPVAVIAKFKDYDEVIKLANDSVYGLASCVFTENIHTGNKFARDIKSGTVWVNSSNDEEISVPFGGFKMSGIGRELGEDGMSTYLQTKAIHMNIFDE